MAIESSQCDDPRVVLFLDQKLSDREQEQFESHLENCAACCERLLAQTAESDSWSDASEYLRDEPFDLNPLSGELSPDEVASDQIPVDARRVLDLLSPTDDPRMLGRLGTYEVAGVIGSGGMGIVLKAFDGALNRYVAIKVLAPHLAMSVAARKRFSREAQAAAAVVHDNVIEIHGVAESDGLPYLVMPYVRGESLQRRLGEQGLLSLVEILRISMQAASGLAAAHAQGLVHRDVKPANMLLAEGVERVKLTDFGLARAVDDASLTRTGVIAGTPQYMSPEQARGDTVDHRSDLFGLGSVMYTMCTGHAPFRAESSYGILRRITDSDPRPIQELNPEIPSWLCRVIERLHAKSPDDRFQSAAEVAELLGQCLAHVQQPTTERLPDLIQPVMSDTGSRLWMLRSALAVGIALAASLMWIIALPMFDRNDPGDGARNIPIGDKNAPQKQIADDRFADVSPHELQWNDKADQHLLEIGKEMSDLETRSLGLFEENTILKSTTQTNN